jgi:hypothetical protein
MQLKTFKSPHFWTLQCRQRNPQGVAPFVLHRSVDKEHIDLPHKSEGRYPPGSTFPKPVFKNFQTPTQG